MERYLGHRLHDEQDRLYIEYKGYRLYSLPDGKCRLQERGRVIATYNSQDEAVAVVSDITSDINHSGRE